MQLTPLIQGAKKGNKASKKPHIQKDTAASTAFFKGLYGLCEGEILGLADGGKSIRLDGTPIINANGTPNFEGVKWSFRSGTLRQEHIAGFPSVENETAVNVELRHDRPFIKYFSNTQLSAVRVRLNWNALRQQHDNGDVVGYRIDYAIDVQSDGGQFVEVLKTAIHDKTSQGYKRSHRIDLPSAKRGWSVRVRRLTANADSELISDKMTVDAVTEIIDAKLTYPCTALLGLEYDAQIFSSIAKLAVRLKGKLIQVPSNYNPETRQYSGLWDGTFKLAYSNNPAWVYYDLCTHKRYGLGERLAGLVDKWSLYRLAQYCDELVDDGKGGTEPRFTCNVYIQKAEDAYQILQNIASIFRAMSYWNGEQIALDADTPKQPVYTFSRANVVGGEFTYTGTRARDRHSVIQVGWDNPDNDFKTEYEFVRDERAIAKYGIKKREINAFGCTSRGQATRVGQWALLSEQLETRTVQFKTGLMGFIPQVGQVVNIADDIFAGRAISGQVLAVSSNQRQITLDRVAGKAGDTLMVNGADGTPKQAIITAVRDNVLSIATPLDVDTGAIWAIVSDDLRLMQFRIMSIKQNDDATFDVEALQYDSHKFALSDKLGMTPQIPYSVLKPEAIQAPEHIAITATSKVVQGVNITTLSISWAQVKGAVAYQLQWRKDDGNWINAGKLTGLSHDIEGVYAGNYMAQVQAIDGFDNESLPAFSPLTAIQGKTGKPPRLARLTATGILFGMDLAWTFNKGSDDTNFTEIQVSPDGRSNIAMLGTFAYPTNKHEITGLQGNLTQHYRARIVDKLGNTSDWTAWVKGVTEAQADKVLDLIQGQIRQSHLDQSLRTPIGKIGSLETAVAGVNGQLGTLNQSLATAQRELSTAKSTLQTAVANITTERNRISSAIRDIGALQSANTARTQEIANLRQTVNGHTSSIRELGVSTGDLAQKYSQLKTVSDRANAEITSIKQTQSGQATSIERLNSEMANKASTASLNTVRETLATADTALGRRIDAVSGEFKQADTAIKASIQSESQARTSADNALSSRINALDSKFTTADNAIKASVTQAQQTASNAQQALATAQSQLNAKIDGINVGGRNLLIGSHATRSTHGTTALNVSQNIDFVNVRQLVLSADVKYANARRASTQGAKWFRIGAEIRIVWTDGTSNWYGAWRANVANAGSFHGRVALKISVPAGKTIHAIDNAKIQIWDITGDGMLVKNAKLEIGNTPTDWTPAPEDASVAIGSVQASIDEFKSAQATKDNATASRITALDTAYKQADSATTARLAREEGARASADTALTQRMDSLQSTVNGNKASVDSQLKALSDKDKAQAQKLSQLESNLNSKANASALNQTNTKVSQVEGRITAEAQKTTTLQTTVGSHTASIAQHSQAINGLNAQWTVKVESGGIVAGIGLASSSGKSVFAIRANQFYVADPTGTAKRPLFSVQATTQTVNGVVVPKGVYLDSAYIKNGSIDIAKINKASIQSLSALSANIGHFKSAETGARLEIKDGVLLVYDSNNRLRARLGVW